MKSQKLDIQMQKRFLFEYKDTNIFRIYFLQTHKVGCYCDLKFFEPISI